MCKLGHLFEGSGPDFEQLDGAEEVFLADDDFAAGVDGFAGAPVAVGVEVPADDLALVHAVITTSSNRPMTC